MSPPHPGRIYHLHPLLAGPVAEWPRHFARCRRMGFTAVLLAPPFQPGRAGSIFLTADHRRLHPALGGQDATAALALAADAARAEGLALLLDLVLDRLDAASAMAPPDAAADAPPDPRLPSDYRFASPMRHADGVLPDWWRGLLVEWLQAGIAGFRCDAAHRLPASLWQRLIAELRRERPDTLFIAWTLGAGAAEMRSLSPCGFDMAASSSWAWDMRADWLDADTKGVAALGMVLAMPEMPFGARLAAAAPPAACLRALRFAAAFGQAWLLPMGFEYGARARMEATGGRPGDFAALALQPAVDFTDAVGEANALHANLAGHRWGEVVSAPLAGAAALRRRGADTDALILANADADNASDPGIAALRPRLGGVEMAPPDMLDAAEVTVVPMRPAAPILLPRGGGRGVSAATTAPRIAIEAIAPTVEHGRFAARRRVGAEVEVAADVICDGHERLAVRLLWRPADAAHWQETPMTVDGNDRWTACFPLERLGRYLFTVEAWIDVFAGFRDGLGKLRAANAPLEQELREGCVLMAQAAAAGCDAALASLTLRLEAADAEERLALLLSEETAALMAAADRRPFRTRHDPPLAVEAEREAASFAAWYELFPRSMSGMPDRHGTFDDVIARLPAIADMGFDVLYMPPIHPIGTTSRKGRNNALTATPGDPGSPYAIGSREGGHDAIHPQLGSFEDFRRLVAAAAVHGMEVALDFAIQCSPDHPWLREHPDWFSWRADGTLRTAENPPKKYEDIVNVAFYADAAMPALWLALRDIVLFWIGHGVRIFRVDNPHTKPLPFWAWMIGEVRARHPDAIFLAEAFTRPKMMYRLGKIGFSQSYTYFTWRDTAAELREYMTELTTTPVREFFRPHFFVNTPDINPLFLQRSGRTGFLIRAALAATLSGLWGMYSGFELCESAPLPGREEYLDSEKYEIRARDWNAPGNIIAEIRALNRIRHANPALHSHLGVTFLPCSNPTLLCFVKSAPGNVVIVAIGCDPGDPMQGEIDIAPDTLGLGAEAELQAEDLMTGEAQSWRTGARRIRLDARPFSLWRVTPT